MIELKVIHPDRSEQTLTFDKDQILIGRHPANDIAITLNSVGLRHARFCLHRGVWWVEDLKSALGTRVNGEPLSSPRLVNPHDKIEVGDRWVEVLRLDATLGTRPAGGVSAASPSGQELSPQTRPLQAPQTELTGFSTSRSQPLQPPAPPWASASSSVGQGVASAVTESAPSSLPPSPLPEGPAWVPPAPRSIDDSGLRRTVVVDLILKSIYLAGELSGLDLRDQMKLPYDVIEPVLQELRRDKLIDVKGGGTNFGSISMTFYVTTKGTESVRQTLDRNGYIGPAPITMETYLESVSRQSVRKLKIPKRRMVSAFQHLIIDDYIFDGIGPALNSGTAILFYGPPGNGKTAICQGMINCLGGGIFIPYAIEADGNIIKVYDEHNHKPIERPSQLMDVDQRFVYCQRPLIMVGGELELDMLDMSYSSDAKYYEAPFQMKANGGILLVDDFGRQKVSPKDLLNRWIVPLESQIDFISLVTGRKLKIPFDVFVAFATNLNPNDLVDDAFLRRVRYKLEVQRPELSLFKKLFELACKAQKIPFDEQGFEFLVGLYARDKRPMNACEPRNIVSAVASLADYFERPALLEKELLERAYGGYFTKFSVA